MFLCELYMQNSMSKLSPLPMSCKEILCDDLAHVWIKLWLSLMFFLGPSPEGVDIILDCLCGE